MTPPASRPGFPPPTGDRGPAGGTAVISAVPRRDDLADQTKARGTVLGLRAGQIVAAQIAAVLLAAAWLAPLWYIAAGPVALLLLVLAFGRMRRRWLYQWISQGTRYFGRRRALPTGSQTTDLLGLVRPAATISSVEVEGLEIGVLTDAYGLTAVLEIGNPTALLAEAQAAVPSPGSLLPAAVAEQPVVRMQLILSGTAAPTASAGAATAATSYRQLTEGRILANQRILLAVHVGRAGGFAEDDLRRSLASSVRRARRRLDRAKVQCRPLSGENVLQALADLAHHDAAHPVRETWSGVEIGGMRQTCFQLTRMPDLRGELAQQLLVRLLTMPGGATTVSLTVERAEPDSDNVRVEMVIRLSAPTPATLGASIDALRSLLGTAGARARRLDGAQLDALAATLPLGGASGGPAAVLNGMVSGNEVVGLDGSTLTVGTRALSALEVPTSGAGLMLGVNRRNEAVTVRLFRPEPTRAALIGGLRCAQVLVLRALAVGAQVAVQSGRPYAWEPFLRGVSARGTNVINLIPPGQVVDPPPASPLRPQLIVVDIGPVGNAGIPVVEAPWRTTLLVRDELNQADLDMLARADLALLQPLTPNEAYVASAALGLGDSASWLTKIRADMVGVVVGRRTLRWALISSTPIEQQLIGVPTR